MRRVLSLLVEIKETQRLQSNQLNSILRRSSEPLEQAALPGGISFPLKSLEQFTEIEERLKDQDCLTAVVSISYIFSFDDDYFLVYVLYICTNLFRQI